MSTNSVLKAQITVALQNVRRAREGGDPIVIEASELHLDRLLDRLQLVPV